MPEIKNRWKAIIVFGPNKQGKLYELESIKLKLKPVTRKQAEVLVRAEAEKTGWSNYGFTLSAI